jgi:hypothetical protein
VGRTIAAARPAPATARIPVVAVAPPVRGPAIAAPDELRGDTRRHRRGDELDALGLGALLLLGSEDRHDGDALDLEIGLGPQHVTGLGSRMQQLTVDHAPRLHRAGGPPRPRAVRARAGEFDVDPASHGLPTYRLARRPTAPGPRGQGAATPGRG